MDRKRFLPRPAIHDGYAHILGGRRDMTHITCDHCGKQLRSGQDHFIVKIEVFAAHDPAEITEADLEEDHMEAVSQLLREMEDADEADALEPTSQHLRYDLCPDCRRRFLRDPLSKDSIHKFDFSEN
jgi:hypothetical protein